MKKNFKKQIAVFLILASISAKTVAAVTCAGGAGTVINGNDGMTTYCASRVQMNWWSAFAWCDAAGMRLIGTDACNGADGRYTGPAACPNLYLANPDNFYGYYWTKNKSNDRVAYYISLSNRHGDSNLRETGTTGFGHALCQM